MSMRDYWLLGYGQREVARLQAQKSALEQEAEERGMLIHEGKLIQPEDYPCECKLQSPYHCYEEQHGVRAENAGDDLPVCECPCHSYWQPF